MSKDGRGRPGRYVPKNQPRLHLVDVLRRRRSSIKQLMSELGITTYGALENWCARMGIAPPTEEQYSQAVTVTTYVNSPQEGVVVLEPPPVLKESTGERIDVDLSTGATATELPTEPLDEVAQKKRTKKTAST